jgi:hypothetical protein
VTAEGIFYSFPIFLFWRLREPAKIAVNAQGRNAASAILFRRKMAAE